MFGDFIVYSKNNWAEEMLFCKESFIPYVFLSYFIRSFITLEIGYYYVYGAIHIYLARRATFTNWYRNLVSGPVILKHYQKYNYIIFVENHSKGCWTQFLGFWHIFVAFDGSNTNKNIQYLYSALSLKQPKALLHIHIYKQTLYIYNAKI